MVEHYTVNICVRCSNHLRGENIHSYKDNIIGYTIKNYE